MSRAALVCLSSLCLFAAEPKTESKTEAALDALSPFNEIIADWRCAGSLGGADRSKGLWHETSSWVWKLTDGATAIRWKVTDGKHFKGGLLTYDTAAKHYKFETVRADDSKAVYTGNFDTRRRNLILEGAAAEAGLKERFTIRLLHANRHIILLERGRGGRDFSSVGEIGCTKQGEPFAIEEDFPKCVVSGGRGTSSVRFEGKSYLVCCTGCRAAFDDDPKRWIADAIKKGWLKP